MRLSLKAKLTALITLLVLLVVVVTSTVYISNLTRQALQEVQSKGDYIANEAYHQAGVVLAGSRLPAGQSPQDFEALRSFVQTRLSSDPGLKSAMESAVGYFPFVDYVAITDSNLVSPGSQRSRRGRAPPCPCPPFTQLLQGGMVRQLRTVYGPPQDYEVILPLAIGAEPLDVRVGVSTVLLRDEITPNLHCGLTAVARGDRIRHAFGRRGLLPRAAAAGKHLAER